MRRAAIWLSLLLLGCAGTPPAVPGDSEYVLPYPEGEAHLVLQGNDGWYSHSGSELHAYDFLAWLGSVVTAARAGVVTGIKQDSDRTGAAVHNNYVEIEHADGTVAYYGHLEPQSVLVEVGERVAQRQPIARTGWTGYALLPHLHFDVTENGGDDPVPVRFADVEGDGVPQAFRCYRAGPAPAAR